MSISPDVPEKSEKQYMRSTTPSYRYNSENLVRHPECFRKNVIKRNSNNSRSSNKQQK